MGHLYRFKRGDRVKSGRLKWATVEGAVSQRTVDLPNDFAPGYHVVLDAGRVVTVRWESTHSFTD